MGTDWPDEPHQSRDRWRPFAQPAANAWNRWGSVGWIYVEPELGVTSLLNPQKFHPEADC
jgi:hypothetical protein